MTNKIVLLKEAIRSASRKHKVEDVLRLISSCANILYQYNQTYVDEELERILLDLDNRIDFDKSKIQDIKKRKDIIFYDGFGMDNRGIAIQYMDALITNGFHVTYIVKKEALSKMPYITGIIGRDDESEIIGYNEHNSYVERIKFIFNLIKERTPYSAFIYTKPSDTVAVVVFNHCKKMCKRYLIDLTDHAFWLGKYSADYFIEFRNYGASIARDYRHISSDRIIKLPFYPHMEQWEPFKGFPFKKDEKVVIFSGGALYKTYDGKNNEYYRVIEQCMEKCKNLIFWYAGSGDDSGLIALSSKFPNRVYHTKERKDLFDILRYSDIYYNTYPQTGGLMMQYAAIAGKAPITLLSDVSGGEELLDEDLLGIKYETVNQTAEVLIKMINEPEYRAEINSRVANTVISVQQFRKNLFRIINDSNTEFEISYKNIDIKKIHNIYRKRFSKYDFERNMYADTFICFLKYKPVLAIKVILLRAIDKMNNLKKGKIRIGSKVLKDQLNYEKK